MDCKSLCEPSFVIVNPFFFKQQKRIDIIAPEAHYSMKQHRWIDRIVPVAHYSMY